MPGSEPVSPAAGCTGASCAEPQPTEPTVPDNGVAGAHAEEPEAWTLLIEGEWQLPAGSEGYRCVRQTLQQDIHLAGLRALSPQGTHHTVLGVGPSTGPDGISDCNAGELGQRMVFGSGVGTDSYELPDGVALRLRAGEQLLLNLHLFNATQAPISGNSGTFILSLAASEVEHVADNILAGSTSLTIPPGPVTQNGSCTMSHDVTLISVFPHMHQLGVHMTATAHSSLDGDVMLHDAPYDFDLQTIYALEEVRMRAGDTVSIECAYQNDTDRMVRFGDSSLAEMCFLGLFRYPAADNSSFFICTR
jgi:hypothetical protein